MSTLAHLALVVGCTATATIVCALYGPSLFRAGPGLQAIVRRFTK